MKRCSLSYDVWKCIKSKKLKGKHVSTDFFKGYIGLLEIEEVSEKQIWKFNGEDIIVCEVGRKWLSILPKNDLYCITAMMDEKDNILLWYIDMIASQGIATDGVPYFDDLYLDLVVYSDGTIIVDDMNELEDALITKDITQEQFNLAVSTADKLKRGLLGDMGDFITYTLRCKELLN